MVSYLEENNKIQFYEVVTLSIIIYCFCLILKTKSDQIPLAQTLQIEQLDTRNGNLGFFKRENGHRVLFPGLSVVRFDVNDVLQSILKIQTGILHKNFVAPFNHILQFTPQPATHIPSYT